MARRSTALVERVPEQREHPSWKALLLRAVQEPGTISAAYSAFWRYSFSNMVLVYCQTKDRGLDLGPIAGFHTWLKRGRRVRKGEKALMICLPRQGKAREETSDEQRIFTYFVYKPCVFVLDQTEGDDWDASLQPTPTWNRQRAEQALAIKEVKFKHQNGNVQGYSRPAERTYAINPVAQHPLKTLFHEWGHIVLEHAVCSQDTDEHPRGEVEAEMVALLVGEALGLADEAAQAESRGYIQHYMGIYLFDEKLAMRVMATAGKILAAGQPERKRDEQEEN